MILDKLAKEGVIKIGANCPHWMLANTCYLTEMGSNAYGVSAQNSDVDVYGVCIPPKYMLFPHIEGHIPGFGPKPEHFDQWQQHHLKFNKTEYDFSVYSIVRFFQLCAENNPNMIDSLFTPRRCVLHATDIGNYIRQNRNHFLHKGSFHKFRGYAFAQMAKIRSKTNSSNEKRADSIAEFGYDTKFAYHVVRLALECEQILETGDLDLERDREIMKSIRKGEWKLEDLESWFASKEKQLELSYANSTLRHEPDYKFLRGTLLTALEMHYGSLSDSVVREDATQQLVNELQETINRYR